MNKKILIRTLIWVFVPSFISCNSKRTTAEEQEVEKVSVKIFTAIIDDVEQSIMFTGSVEAKTLNNIAPQTSARIKKINVEVGDPVRQGQILAQMDAVNLDQIELQLRNDKIEFERVDRLYDVGGVSKSEWDAKKLAYDLSQKTFDNLQENTVLISPINGVVSRRNYDSGDMYSMDDPIFVIERLRPVKLVVNVSEVLYSKIYKDMDVSVTFDVYGEEKFKGKVKLVHPTIDSATRTFPVEVEIPNDDVRIRSGMFARVTFNYGIEKRVILPDLAIQKQTGSGDRYVYIINNDEAQFRKVTLGSRIGSYYEILEGVQMGENVAVTGQARLNQGTRVIIDHSPISSASNLSQNNNHKQ